MINRQWLNSWVLRRCGSNSQWAIILYEGNTRTCLRALAARYNQSWANCFMRWMPVFNRGPQNLRDRGPVNSLHKWPVTRKMFPFDDVIMSYSHLLLQADVSCSGKIPLSIWSVFAPVTKIGCPCHWRECVQTLEEQWEQWDSSTGLSQSLTW